MSEEKNLSWIPEINNNLKKRLLTPVGYIVSSINAPNEQDISGSAITARINSINAQKIRNFDYLLAYDFLRGEILGLQVKSNVIMDLDNSNNYQNLLTEDFTSTLELFEKKRLDFLLKPQFINLEAVCTFDTNYNKLGEARFTPIDRAILYEPNKEELLKIIGIKDQETVLTIGGYCPGNQLYLSNEESIPIKITKDSLRTHLSVNGQSGTGKTQLLKSIILQLHGGEYALLITDTQGDIAGQLWRQSLHEGQKKLIEEHDQKKLWFMLGWNKEQVGIPKEDITIFYPCNLDINDDPILLDAKKNDVSIKPLFLNSSDIETPLELTVTLSNINQTQYEAIQILYSSFMDSLTDKRFNLDGFIRHVSQLSEKGIEGVVKSTLGVIKRKLEVLKSFNILDRSDTPTIYSELMCPKKIAILYIPIDNPEVKQIQRFVELLVFKKITKKRRDPNQRRAIIIDEAQDLIPNPRKSHNDDISKALAERFEELATQGRKYWISLIVASQKPSSIHPTVFSQCSNRLFFRLSNLELPDVQAYFPAEYRSAITHYKRLHGLFVSPETIDVEAVEIKCPVPAMFHTDPSELYVDFQKLEDENETESAVKVEQAPKYSGKQDLGEKDWEEEN